MLNRPTCKKGLGAHIILCKRLLSCYVCDYGNVSASCSSNSAHHYYRIFAPFRQSTVRSANRDTLTPPPLGNSRQPAAISRGEAPCPGSFVAVVVRVRLLTFSPGNSWRGPPRSRKFFDVYDNEKEVKNRRISTRPSGARRRRTEREPEVIRKRGSRGGSMHFSRFISTGLFSPPRGWEQPVDQPDEPRN